MRPEYPIIADTELAVAKAYSMLPASDGDSFSRTHGGG